MANLFNDYFSSVFTDEATTCFPAVDPTGTPLVPDSIEFTPEMAYNIIMSLHNNKFPGPDGWPIPIIKSVSDVFAIPLFIILNHSTLELYHMTGKCSSDTYS